MTFIVFVQAYDMYWSIKLQDTLMQFELNPMGVWLMEIDDGSVALFMSTKLFGTFLALAILAALCHYKFQLGFLACCALICSQGFLLWFLNYGHLLQ